MNTKGGESFKRGSLAVLFGTLLAFAASQTSCDKLNEMTGKSSDKAEKEEDGEKKKKKKKKKDDEEEEEEEEASAKPSAEPTASAAPTADPADAGADDAATAAADDAGTAEEEEDSDAVNADTVTRYDDEVPQGGTVRTKVPFRAYQAADLTSKKLADIGVGTFVNLKASHANWMLIEYPSGVAELSLGWIELKSRYDKNSVEDAKPPPDSALNKPKRDGGRRDGGRKKRDGGGKLIKIPTPGK